MKKKSILYITQTFPPEPGATARPLLQSIHLQKYGYKVTILTTMPNYPIGKIYEGYRGKAVLKEELSGIEVRRVWSVPAASKGFVKRIISHLSFAIIVSIYGLFLKRHDIVLASVPNIGTELAGYIIGKLKRSTVILELRDLIPENLKFIGVSDKSFIYKTLDWYYNYMNSRMDKIIVPSIGMLNRLVKKGIDTNKIIFLPHATEKDRLLPQKNDENILKHFTVENKFIVLYTGSFNAYYDVLNYVHAAKEIQEVNSDICFVLVGQGADYDKAKALVAQEKIKNVKLTGALCQEKIECLQRAAHIALTTCYSPTSITPDYMYNTVYTKIAEYLMTGNPIIAVETGEILGSIIADNNLGCIIEPKNPRLLANSVLTYFNDPELRKSQRDSAIKYAMQYHDRQKVMAGCVEHLENIGI